MSYEFRSDDEFFGWSEDIFKAGKEVYKRIKLTHQDWPKWKDLDLDSIDHYCLAARNAIEVYLEFQIERVSK